MNFLPDEITPGTFFDNKAKADRAGDPNAPLRVPKRKPAWSRAFKWLKSATERKRPIGMSRVAWRKHKRASEKTHRIAEAMLSSFDEVVREESTYVS